MLWFLPLIVFLLFITWILMVPVMILVHTDTGRYSLSLPGIFMAKAVSGGESFLIKGRILFVPYRFNPFAIRKKRTRKKKTGEGKKKKFRMPRGGLSLVRDALRAIRIRSFELDLDTGDYPLNAWLFPLFSMAEGSNRRLDVNFTGYNALSLDVRIRLGALLWAVIRNRIKHSYSSINF